MTNTNDLIEKAVAQAISESDDRNHEALCHCGSWPESCVTYGDRKPWSHDAEEVARAALAAFEKASTPPNPREVWGYQIGTWPPQQVQSEEIARWYVDNPYTGEVGGTTYPVKVVRGTSFNTVWEVVE